jgi:hypothetical protein
LSGHAWGFAVQKPGSPPPQSSFAKSQNASLVQAELARQSPLEPPAPLLLLLLLDEVGPVHESGQQGLSLPPAPPLPVVEAVAPP